MNYLKTKFFLKKIVHVSVLLASFLMVSCHQKITPFSGYVEGNFVYVASEQSGELTTLAVSRGEKVNKGQLLFKIDPTPYQHQVDQALAALTEAKANYQNTLYGERPSELSQIKAEINQANAQLNYMNKQLLRQESLLAKGSIAKQTFDQTVRDASQAKEKVNQLEYQLATASLPLRHDLIKAAKARIDEAKASLQLATWHLSQTVVKAPASGIVFDNFYWQGEKVVANQPVVSLLEPSKIRLIFYVPQSLFASIKLGQTIYVRQMGGKGNESQATISFISPNTEYTPPIIYSDHSATKLVYRIEAKLTDKKGQFHPGELVAVTLNKSS